MDNLQALSTEDLYKLHRERHIEVVRLRAEMQEIDEVIARKERAEFVPNTQFPAQGMRLEGVSVTLGEN